jgi:hypothetical protein
MIAIKKSGVIIKTFETLEQCEEWINAHKDELEDLEICERVYGCRTTEIACIMLHDLLERFQTRRIYIDIPDSFYQGLKELINKNLVIPDNFHYGCIGKFDSKRKEIIMY